MVKLRGEEEVIGGRRGREIGRGLFIPLATDKQSL
jgi:hypothetical protein